MIICKQLFCQSFVFVSCIKTTVLRTMSSSSRSWRGAPIEELYGANTPWESPEFPPIVPAYNHAVAYHVKLDGPMKIEKPPTPQRGQDKWDKDFVRMPCSNQSLYPVEEHGTRQLKKRWDLIKEALSKPIKNSLELADAIISYNTKFKGQWNFSALHKLFNQYLEEEESKCFFDDVLPKIAKLALALPELIPGTSKVVPRNFVSYLEEEESKCFFDDVLPKIAKLALALPELIPGTSKYLEEEESKCFFDDVLPKIAKLALALPELIPGPLPLLRQQKNRSISLTQEQISSLLANAFFCTFPRRNTTKRTSEYASYPYINLNSAVPTGVMTFARRTVEPSKCPRWPVSSILIGSIPIHINAQGTIEDEGVGLIQVDFANKYLGGGVLNHGCVQEEIRFVICPELLVSMLFTEVLKPTEALFMIGCERYSNYTGYASSFEWCGNHVDKTPRDSSGRVRCAVLAIDALPMSNKRFQFKPTHILRELNKAWVGVSVYTDESSNETLNYPGVATGNWGCGAFGGCPRLKFLIQLMACAQARRPVAYFTFGDTELRNDLINIYNFLSAQNITVGVLFRYLIGFWKSDVPGSELYAYIQQVHTDKLNRPKSPLANNDEIVENEVDQGGADEEENEEEEPLPKNEVPSSKDSPDIFATDSEQNETQENQRNDRYLDLEKGEGILHVNVDSLLVDAPSEASNSNLPRQSGSEKIITSPFFSKNAEHSVNRKNTSSLFQQMTMFDEEHSELNLTCKSPVKSGGVKLSIRDNFIKDEGGMNDMVCEEKESKCETMEDESEPIISEDKVIHRNETKVNEIAVVNNTEENFVLDENGPAKKMAKKITDYFNKKT